MVAGSLLCDLDDTVWSREAAIARWATRLADFNCLPADRTVSLTLQLDAAGSASWGDILRGLRSGLGLSMSEDALFDWHMVSYPEAFLPYPGVADALMEAHSRGWTIAAASNGSNARQRAKLKATGLDHLFDLVVCSDMVEAAKPDARFFKAVLSRMPPSREVWVVGDSPVDDIQGGHRIGAHTGWISAGRRWPGGSRPTVSAPGFPGVLALAIFHAPKTGE